jgi:maltose alpha-D-glucosyltransferase/alpha-amylase
MYMFPLTFATGSTADRIWNEHPEAIAARVQIRDSGSVGILYDALHNEDVACLLLNVLVQRQVLPSTTAQIRPLTLRALSLPPIEIGEGRPWGMAQIKPVKHSNTSLLFDEQFVLKVLRRLEPGVNPELEVGRLLNDQTHFPHVAPTYGALEYWQRGSSEPVTLAILQGFVPHRDTAWSYTQAHLARYFERVLSSRSAHDVVPPPTEHLLTLADEPASWLAQELIGSFLERVRLIGRRTAEMHTVLSEYVSEPNFVPEPFTDFVQRPFYHSTMGLLDRDLYLLHAHAPHLPPAINADAAAVQEREQTIRTAFLPFRDRKITGMRIRCHGAYHLRELLLAHDEVVIIDFEGDPTRTLEERRIKDSPLRDVARMLRSFHHAIASALFAQRGNGINPHTTSDTARQAQRSWVQFWYKSVAAQFLRGYREGTEHVAVLHLSDSEFRLLLDTYVLSYALHELSRELQHRSHWLQVPLHAVLMTLDDMGDG